MLGVIDIWAVMKDLLYLCGMGLIFYVLWWGLQKVALVEPWNTVARVILVIATVLVLVYFILTMLGEPVPIVR